MANCTNKGSIVRKTDTFGFARVIRVAALVLSLVLVFPLQSVNAQKKTANLPVKIIHTLPKASDFPYPGTPVTLGVSISNTKDTDRRMRAFIVRDGQLLDLSVASATFSEQELPTYKFEFHSPFAELLYQFVLYNPDGSTTISDRYFVRRSCAPDITLAVGKVDPSVRGYERFNELIAQAKALDNNIEGYREAISLLKSIKTKLGE